MKLSELKAPRFSGKYKKRRGRGQRSGHGKTSCRGNKGANARSGPTTHIGFEGGQMPLIRRIPKRGFNHETATPFQIVNLLKLNMFQKDSVITAVELHKKGMIRKADGKVKILGSGNIEKALTVKANAFSVSAKGKIEKAGGKTEIV